ncbi:hypothetical protein BJ138DRAFT_975425, partial [Hygrophoropsis aurantiaca]
KYTTQSCLECPTCQEMILVGTGGEGKLMLHDGKAECQKNIKKREAEKKQGKNRTLFDVGLFK